MESPEAPKGEEVTFPESPSLAVEARDYERAAVIAEENKNLDELMRRVKASQQEKKDVFSLEETMREWYLSMIDSPNPLDRAQAAGMWLLKNNEQWQLPLMIKLFSDPDPRVRAELVRNVMLFLRFPQLLEELYRDPSPLVRINAIKWSWEVWSRPDLVQRYLTDESEEVRAAMAHRWTPSMGNLGLVHKLYADPSPRIREAILHNTYAQRVFRSVANDDRSGS